MSEVQERYIHLVREITQLQWVRESLPFHSKYYEGLKKKLEKQRKLKIFSEKERENYQNKHSSNSAISKYGLFNKDSSSNNGSSSKTYNNIIRSTIFYENAIQELQAQLIQAKSIMDELNEEKKKLDDLCNELHDLYDQVIIQDPEDSAYVFEQHLKRDVEQLAITIPDIRSKIKTYTIAQSKLYEARELMETAMKSLPGASTFMDRQAIVASHNQKNNNLLFKSGAASVSSAVINPIKNAEKIAQRSYMLVHQAAAICDDVPYIPTTTVQKGESDVVFILTSYRGYRLKIEYTLRTQVNPRLNQFENQLASTKYQYEQRLIEWIDHQIFTLEAHLRTNGCLENESLDREISMLRMGSRAAIAAVASETSGRVTVDDVLDISSASDHHDVLPEYEEHSTNNSSNSSSDRNSTGSHHEDHPELMSELPAVNIGHELATDIDSNNQLPSYATTSSDRPPPAYTR